MKYKGPYFFSQRNIDFYIELIFFKKSKTPVLCVLFQYIVKFCEIIDNFTNTENLNPIITTVHI